MPSDPSCYDVAVVGAGIVGLAHAYVAAQRGASVVVLERDPRAYGASVRNFGMIFPFGQPAGPRREMALQSRADWLEVAGAAGARVDTCGSILAAHQDDELAVLEEYVASADPAEEVRLLTPAEVRERTEAVRPDGLRGGLWSPSELAVDPREALPAIAAWLAREHGVALRFGACVTEVETGRLATTAGETLRAERTLIASGHELQLLFPRELAAAELVPCKLHMARTAAQPADYRFGPHVAGGLTLRHYARFAACPSVAALKRRVAERTPELDRYGVHVMASRTRANELVLGDSHQYGDEASPFDSAEIDALILRELRQILIAPDWKLAERWTAVYAKHRTRPFVELDPLPGVKLVTGLGGGGMTLSFGVAREVWSRWS